MVLLPGDIPRPHGIHPGPVAPTSGLQNVRVGILAAVAACRQHEQKRTHVRVMSGFWQPSWFRNTRQLLRVITNLATVLTFCKTGSEYQLYNLEQPQSNLSIIKGACDGHFEGIAGGGSRVCRPHESHQTVYKAYVSALHQPSNQQTREASINALQKQPSILYQSHGNSSRKQHQIFPQGESIRQTFQEPGQQWGWGARQYMHLCNRMLQFHLAPCTC